MDTRLKQLADQLDAGLIARREFLRKAAVITGGLTGAIAWALVASLIAAAVVAVIAFFFTLLGGMPGQRR